MFWRDIGISDDCDFTTIVMLEEPATQFYMENGCGGCRCVCVKLHTNLMLGKVQIMTEFFPVV